MVRDLLDDAGPSNMAFTDGPSDQNVRLSSFLKCDLTWIVCKGKPWPLEPSMLRGNLIKVSL